MNKGSSRKNITNSKAIAFKIVYSQNGHLHDVDVSIKEAIIGPMYGDTMTGPAQRLILRGCSWK